MLSRLINMYALILFVHLFFFKQKTAYEMRISDWSSDVCSSDLGRRIGGELVGRARQRGQHLREAGDRGIELNLLGGHRAELHLGRVHRRLDRRHPRRGIVDVGREIGGDRGDRIDRKSTRLNSSHSCAPPIPSFALKKNKTKRKN